MSMLVQGNALQIPLADKSVQCVVTSPPYWGLRSYAGTATWEGGDPECDHRVGSQVNQSKDAGTPRSNAILLGMRPGVDASRCKLCGAIRHDAQLGSEPLHDCLGWATGNDCGECYICHMRQVARECWRVLRDDGVMFWNIADSYNGSGGAGGDYNEGGLKDGQPRFNGRKVSSLKPKDKCGIPERTALAFQADGWWWRSDIIWHKPNPMPESVTDRPTKSHEFIYVFTKAERYFWDAEAVREGLSPTTLNDPRMQDMGRTYDGKGRGAYGESGKANGSMEAWSLNPAGRNLRDVWTMATAPYSGAHFATFPPELPERCIRAATSERGACPKCGKPWERITENGEQIEAGHPRGNNAAYCDNRAVNGASIKKWTKNHKGWRAACTCDAGDPVPCVVLDPFSGAATTGLVARELGRHYVGLELSGEYLRQSRERLSLTALDDWSAGKGNGKAADLSDLPMFRSEP